MSKTTKIVASLTIVLLVLISFAILNKNSNISTETIRLGVLLPLTGQAAHYGESSQKGIELAIKESDSKIEAIYEDNQFDPKVGVSAYQKLKLTSIDAVITQTSPVAVAVQPLAMADGILQMAVSASASTYSTEGDLAFRTTGGVVHEAASAVSHIENTHDRIAILYMNNEIGVSISNEVDSQLSVSNKTKIVLKEPFPVDAIDFRSVILRVKNSGAQGIYFAGLTSHIVVFLKQSEELKTQLPIIGFRTFEDPAIITGAGNLAEGLVFTSGFNADSADKEVQQFTKLFIKQYGIIPDNYAAEGYMGTKLLINAFEECGKDYGCIYTFLSTLKEYPSIFGKVSFDTKGDVAYPFFLKTIQKGVFTTLSDQSSLRE